MKFISTAILSLSILSISFPATISANPILVRAAKQVSCSYFRTGSILATTGLGSSDREDHHVGLSVQKLSDPYGGASTFLTTKKADGTEFGEDEFKFDFQSCDSEYMNWHTSYSRYNTYYGHVTPSVSNHNAKHCLTLRSGDVDSASTLMSDPYCKLDDDATQLANYFSFVNGYYNSLAFLGVTNATDSNVRDSYITISPTGRLHFKSGKAPEGTKVFYLSFF